MAEPVIHHRSPDFKDGLQRGGRAPAAGVPHEERRARLHRLRHRCVRVRGRQPPLARREGVLVVSHGEFGTRWQKLAAAFGCDVVALDYAWGETPRAEDVSRALAESGARVALLVHSETSTGVVSDIRSLVAACNDAGVISVVDAISSLGAVPLETDDWGIDVVVTGSQKALMTPPGLAFASISERAWAKLAGGDAAAVLLGLGERAQEPGEGQHAVHAGDVDRRCAQRRARADPRRGARERLRAPRRARPRLPRGREGDGPRALLAGRRQRRRADGHPDARGNRRRRAAACAARPVRHHDRRAATATSSTASSGSATSATSTSSTSRRRSERSSCSSSRWARRSSEARPVLPRSPPTQQRSDRARPRPRVDRRCRGRAAALEVRGRRGSDDAARGDHRPTTTRS